ncbi:MAG TPA: hypothetical protein VFQ53_31735 [Kofleriaceae bacterium]|nr:hypothetical protein [Kofleriaceae bacterium]
MKPALALIVLAACGGASYQNLTLVNRTSRPVDEIYVYPLGATDHGKSRGSLVPNGSTKLQVKTGRIEVLGVSSKIQLDEHTRDKPSGSIALELKRPSEVVFYDEAHPPAGLDRPDTYGVAFKLPVVQAPEPDATPP